jgi:hypothetical protein
MATMFPPEWNDVNGSRAEGHMYRRLRAETPGDWYAIHSVGLTSHAHKTWAEIDFALVGPFGTLCIEVKGGRVTVDHGSWATNDKALRESPFQQAGGGAAALRAELRDLFPALRRALVEYAVAFPDVRFDGDGPGIEPEILYDERDVGAPFRAYINRVVDYWRERRQLDTERFRPLSRSERSAIAAWLAPTVNAIPSLRARIADAEAELVELTKLQARALRGMRTKPRALIRGGAGTGKTLLAIEEASRLAAEGKRVLVCCRSPLLADFLRESSGSDLIEMADMQALMERLVAEAGRTDRIPDADDEDVFSIFLPEQAAEAALDLQRDGAYDALVVDEAQDLMFEGALDLLDVLLDGGLEHGTWRVFLDHKQNVFSAVDRTQFERLSESAVTEHDLVDNCRNTPEVATTTALLAAVSLDETLAASGPDVELRFVDDRRDEFVQVAGTLAAWIRRGIPAESIVLLGDGAEVPAALSRELPVGTPVPVPYTVRDGRSPSWCSIEDFKGLEAGAVIVTGIRDLDTREMLRRVYVACSRARSLLAVMIAERARETFNERAAEFARRQSEGQLV